jgi:hypothetical protein
MNRRCFDSTSVAHTSVSSFPYDVVTAFPRWCSFVNRALLCKSKKPYFFKFQPHGTEKNKVIFQFVDLA